MIYKNNEQRGSMTMMNFYSKRNVTMSLIFSSVIFSSNMYCMLGNGLEKTKKIAWRSVLNPNNYVRAATISSFLYQVNAITPQECFDMCIKELPNNVTFASCLSDCVNSIDNTDYSSSIAIAIVVPCTIFLFGGMVVYTSCKDKKNCGTEEYKAIG